MSGLAGVIGTGYSSDIAVDDLSVTAGACPSTEKQDCGDGSQVKLFSLSALPTHYSVGYHLKGPPVSH